MRIFLENQTDFYFSTVTRKELLKKRGLKTSHRQEIKNLLSAGKEIFLNPSILEGVRLLYPLFMKKGVKDTNDMIIAATALVKNLPLATLNRKHFVFIKGLKLIKL